VRGVERSESLVLEGLERFLRAERGASSVDGGVVSRCGRRILSYPEPLSRRES